MRTIAPKAYKHLPLPWSITKMPDDSPQFHILPIACPLVPINSEFVDDERKALQYMVLRKHFLEDIHNYLSVITHDSSLKLGG
jgi:hypothetical protein